MSHGRLLGEPDVHGWCPGKQGFRELLIYIILRENTIIFCVIMR
jgi:hypothetical protein